jgi:hypothetical protein
MQAAAARPRRWPDGEGGIAMSMFENPRYRWRETYFVLFRSSERPSLKAVEKALHGLSRRYTLANLRADDEGRFESLTLVSPDDFSALDICYTTGAEVLEQGANLAQEIQASAKASGQHAPVAEIRQCDARFDVLHFEQLPDFLDEEEGDDEVLDPSALLLVLDTLARLTGGVAVDPQSGTMISE